MSNEIIFVSPHSKKIGETYVLPRLVGASNNESINVSLFNVCGEWDSVDQTLRVNVIQNKCRWIASLSPDIEWLSPWWNYRVWLFFVSVSIAAGLPLSLGRARRSTIVMRMATSGGAVAAMFTKKSRFVASMAGVPHRTPLRRLTWPFLYQRYQKIIVPCESMLNAVADISRRSLNAVEVIPNAVLDQSDGGSLTFHSDFNASCLNIVMVGRLTRQKGVDTAIKALAKLKSPAMLHLIGEGEDFARLAQLAQELGVKDKVTFLGYQADPWRQALKYDLFIMPSRWEGPGHSIIEALAFGMPSIVSDCPFGPEESIGYGDYGDVVPVDDECALAAAINNVFNNYEQYVNKASEGSKHSHKYRPSGVIRSWKRLHDGLWR